MPHKQQQKRDQCSPTRTRLCLAMSGRTPERRAGPCRRWRPRKRGNGGGYKRLSAKKIAALSSLNVVVKRLFEDNDTANVERPWQTTVFVCWQTRDVDNAFAREMASFGREVRAVSWSFWLPPSWQPFSWPRPFWGRPFSQQTFSWF